MDYATWLAFTIMATLIVMSPGPNGVIVLKTVGQYGYRPALLIVSGLFCATFMHGLFVLFGLSALLIYVPQAFMAIKIIGALYLCYLGIKSLTQFFKYNSLKNTVEEASISQISNHKKLARHFWQTGFITQILNPKVSALYLAIIPNFVDFTSTTAAMDTLLLTFTHASIVGSWFILLATVSMKLLPYFKNASIGRWLNGLAGVVMLYFSAMLLTYEAKKA